MLNRKLLALLTIPLAALTIACSSPVTAVEQEPPPTPRVTEVPNLGSTTPPEATTPASTPSSDGQPQAGVSPRTTPGHVWAEAAIDGDKVTIRRTVATMGDHVHFEVPSSVGSAGFIGYFVGPAFLVRPCVCPSCGDEGVDWSTSELSCQSCAAAYDAVTGTSKAGGVCYPDGLVPSRFGVDTISMSQQNLLLAYERAAAAEALLYENSASGDGTLPACCPGH